MKRTLAPCKGCNKRTVGDPEHGIPNCHMVCEAYIEFAKNEREYTITASKARIANRKLTDLQWRMYLKHHKGIQS